MQFGIFVRDADGLNRRLEERQCFQPAIVKKLPYMPLSANRPRRSPLLLLVPQSYSYSNSSSSSMSLAVSKRILFLEGANGDRGSQWGQREPMGTEGANGDRSNIEPPKKRSTGCEPTRFMRLESTKLLTVCCSRILPLFDLSPTHGSPHCSDTDNSPAQNKTYAALCESPSTLPAPTRSPIVLVLELVLVLDVIGSE
jgi:hypothetical protein